MRERLIHRHAVEVRPRAAPERAARGGEDQAVDGAGRLARDELVQRGVLGVHGDELRAGRLRERDHELAAHHERLLVGERQVDALAQRGDGRAQARRAHERVEHEVGVGLHDQAHEPLGAREHLAVGPRLRGTGAGIGVRKRDPPHPMRLRLLDQPLP